MGSFGKEGRHAKVPCETHGSVGDDKKREIREQENAFAQRLMANDDDDFPTMVRGAIAKQNSLMLAPAHSCSLKYWHQKKHKNA